jgi:hypothetical protein
VRFRRRHYARRGKIGAREEARDPPFIGTQACAFLGAHAEVGRGGGRGPCRPRPLVIDRPGWARNMVGAAGPDGSEWIGVGPLGSAR